MRCSLRHGLLVSLAVGLLWLLLTLQIPGDMDTGRQVHPLLRPMPPGGYGTGWKAPRPRPLEDWQALTSRYLKTIQQRRKTWLTVGISAGSGPDPNGLLYTLTSLFRAASRGEQKHLAVLVHLADPDLSWLGDTVRRIASLFGPQILAGRLLLIHAPPEAYSAPEGGGAPAGSRGDHGVGDTDTDDDDPSSRQNAAHAFLLSFAAELSSYFLLLRDNTYCAPGFLAHLRRRVWALRARPWALLEFSNRDALGKLIRSRDLPRLARFLLLFRERQPLGGLLARFRALRAQGRPVLCRPFLFHYRVSYPQHPQPRGGGGGGGGASSQDRRRPWAAPSRGPHNPPAAVFTDMRVFEAHAPWEAYTLDESFFWTHGVRAGSHLTVLLNRPANLSRVQVLTGTAAGGRHALRRGQVELGRRPEGVPAFCTSFALLGQLLEGQLDLEARPGLDDTALDDTANAAPGGSGVSCVRLVANADQAGGLMVRHIYLWAEEEQQRDDAGTARAVVAARG